MTWFDRVEGVLTFIALVCALYVAVIFGQFIALVIQGGGPR